jgi:hypothetical protein
MKVLRSFLLMLILLSLPILACSVGGGGEETPAATVAATQASSEATATTAAPATTAPEATATTAAPEATATTETADVDLGEEYSDEAAGITLQYPSGWATSGFGGFIIFASDQQLIDDTENIDEGAVAVVVAGAAAEMEVQSDDPVEVLQAFLADFDFTDDMAITDGPRALTINGQDAATAEITGTSDSGIPLVATATAILSGERVAVIFTATPQDGAEAYTPLLEAMVQTVEVSEPVVTTPDVEGTLVYGDSVQGAVTADSPSAWSFVGFEGETVNITAEPATDDFDLTVDVLDETGTSILDSGPVDASFGTEEIVDLAIPTTGEYFIVVAGFGGATGEFTLTLNQAGGTSTTGGEAIVVGDSFEGSVEANGSVDYSFTGVSGETVTIRVTPEADFDVMIEVYDSSGAQLESVDASFGEETLEFTVPADDTYTIRVLGFAGDSGAYTISLEGAGTGTNGNTGEIVLLNEAGSLEANQSRDYDVTNLEPGDTLIVVVEPEGEMDAVITLFDAQGAELDEVDASFGTETLTYQTASGGNFVVNVSEFSGAAGSYTINISVSVGGTGTTTTPTTTDAGSVINAADTLEANDEHAFPFTALAPTTVSMVVTPIGDLDVIVQVWTDASEDEQLEEVDASFGAETVEFAVEEPGDYYFLVTGFGGAAGDYDVTLTGTPDIVFELAFGDEVSGVVPDNGQIDFYFFGDTGDIFTVNVTSDENLDAVIEIVNFDTGDIEADVDDAFSGETEELTFTLPADGLYIIRVRGFAGGAGSFSLVLE